MVSRVYLDTNFFISAFEQQGEVSELAAELLLAPKGRIPLTPRLVTSELTLSELLVKPLQTANDDLVHEYDYWTTSNVFIEVFPIGRRILRFASELRAARKGLKLPDAIHLATAIETGCRYLLTDDTRLKSTDRIEVVRRTPDILRKLIGEAE